MRKEYIQSAKTELERLQKQGNTAANSTLPSNEPTVEKRAATRPFPAKKKATPFYLGSSEKFFFAERSSL